MDSSQESKVGKAISPKDVRAEQESKRARGALSCAECRRLKLRCDKKIPCSSCQRRGCASICPNGSLTTGQGTRFVLADTERLHKKMGQMSNRIRQLEEALASSHSANSSSEHPLLSNEMLTVKTLQDLHINPDIPAKESKTTSQAPAEFVDAFGTLAIAEDGAARFYGRSGGSESLLLDQAEQSESIDSPGRVAFLPDHVQALADVFPFDGGRQRMQGVIESFLPHYSRAMELCNLYLTQAPWFFGPVSRQQVVEELLPLIYNTSSPVNRASYSPEQNFIPGQSFPAQSRHSSPQSSTGSTETARPHDLALLFIIFATGALVDINLPPPPNNAEAEHYYQLTRAALTLDPILDRAPSITTVQTLASMAIYQGMSLKEDSPESTWTMMGLTCKMAQSIGLHRDGSRWRLEPREVQKRRALFWELFITDSWQSLATGRPPSFTLPYVDCATPQDPDETMDHDGKIQPSFPAWKARFGHKCVTEVVEGTLIAQTPKYANILDLDRKIRDVPLPGYSDETLEPKDTSKGLAEVMKHFMPINYRGYILLYLHRSFFGQAIKDHPIDPLRSQYAPSFLAAYDSACNVLRTLQKQFNLFPQEIARFWPLWTHALSSVIIVGSVVNYGPRSKVAPAALAELNGARLLFEQAAKYGGRAVKILPIVSRFHDKGKLALAQAIQYPPRALAVGSRNDDEEADELTIFSGKARLVVPRQGTSQASSSPQAVSVQNTPPQPPPTYASSSTQMYENEVVMQAPSSFENAHPHLANKLQVFGDHLMAQNFEASGYHSHTPYETSQVPQTHYANHPNHPSHSSHPSHPAPPNHEIHQTHQGYHTLPSQPSHPTQTWSDVGTHPRTHDHVPAPQLHHQPHTPLPAVPAQAPPPIYYYDHNPPMTGSNPTMAHGYKPHDHGQIPAVSMSDTWMAFMSGMNIPAPHPHAKR